VLVSAPCHIPLLRVTAADLAFDARTGEALAPGRFGDRRGDRRIATAADLVRAAGLAVCAEALDARTVERALLAVNRRIAKAERALREMRPSVNVGADVFAFREMGSRGGERFDLLFPVPGRDVDDARKNADDASPYSDDLDEDEDAAFVRELAMTAPWTRTLVEPLLGSNENENENDAADALASKQKTEKKKEPLSWWCDVSVVYSKPGATNQDWHCDGRHLAGAARADFDGEGVADPYAVCVFCPLVDLNESVGFTQFWAGSHKSSDGLIGFGSAAEVLRGTVDGVVKAGGAVAYDYRTMHRGMANNSKETRRPVLQFLYAKSNYRETKNYGAESLFEPP
jgi:ectoine hydroxylase-related dioxygenase (phytanoyl-CoA dioxygenase family)